MMDKIYLVTTVHIEYPVCRSHRFDPNIIRNRSVGWFPTLERAEEVVVSNEGDIYEAGHYNHCVIEEVVPGLYPHITREEWFKWEEGKYVITPRPDKIRAGNIGIV
jgi:hypothetical protein